MKDKSQLCIHLNGYIERLTPNALQKEFKLRNVSYLSTEFVDSEWISLFRNDIKTSDSIFFVGFSLAYDLDLKRIIYDQPETHEKIAFILYEYEKASSLQNSAKFGKNYTIGVKGFASEIEKIKNIYTPPSIPSLVYESFKKIEFGNSVEALRDNDAIDLFY